MYVRGTCIAVLRPGMHGAEIAGERWEAGGGVEKDLLPLGDELDRYRVIIPERLPETVIATLPGKPLRRLLSIPSYKGFSPIHGNDHAGDWLSILGDRIMERVREVERGVLVVLGSEESGRSEGPPLASETAVAKAEI